MKFRNKMMASGQHNKHKTGCKLHNDCLSCPFSDCVVDKPKAAMREIAKIEALKPKTQEG